MQLEIIIHSEVTATPTTTIFAHAHVSTPAIIITEMDAVIYARQENALSRSDAVDTGTFSAFRIS